MVNTPSYAVLSERTGRFVRNRIRPADNSVRSLHHHVQTPQCRSARWPIKSVLPSRTSQHHTEGHAKVCWVIHTVVTRSWAVSGRVNHNLQLTTICALLAICLLDGLIVIRAYAIAPRVCCSVNRGKNYRSPMQLSCSTVQQSGPYE